MSELNERELLLLSNYAYFYCSGNDGTIEENINSLKNDRGEFDRVKVLKQGAVGTNISEDEAIELLEQIDSSEKLKSLEKSRGLDTADLSVTLYTDSEDEATLVFRGTGGVYDAWHDNVLGEYKRDTEIQKQAGDFVRCECAQYKNITVTGHSKGGNLSQYVTVTCPDQIDRCVSYDGQGFGTEFLEAYKDEIENASGKITSISAYNDFVNILLFSIAGTKLFVNNDGTGGDRHSSYKLYSSAEFDENGNFSRQNDVTEQETLMKLVKKATDGLVTAIDMLPDDGNEKVTNVLASLTALIMSGNKSEEYEKNEVKESVSAFKSYAGKMLGLIDSEIELPSVSYAHTSISIDKTKSVYSALSEQLETMYGIPELLEDVLVRLDYSIMGRSHTEAALKRTISRADRVIKMTSVLCETLNEIISKYEAYDAEIIEDINLLYHK